MKKFMLIVAAGLALVAYNTEKKDATATTEDSMAIIAGAPVVAKPEVFNYTMADGKQHFELTVTGENRETATLKDIEGNVVYDMKNAESADGVKWTSEDGHSLWTEGDIFTFFEGDKQLCEGALVVKAPATEAPAAG